MVRRTDPDGAVAIPLPSHQGLGNLLIEALRRQIPQPRLGPGEWEARVFQSTVELLDVSEVLTGVLTGARGEERFEWLCKFVLRRTPAAVLRTIRVAHLIASGAESDGDELSAVVEGRDIDTWTAPGTGTFPLSVAREMVMLRSDKPWAWHLRGTITALILRGDLTATKAVQALKRAKIRARRSSAIPRGQRPHPRWVIRLRDGSLYRGNPRRDIVVEITPDLTLASADTPL